MNQIGLFDAPVMDAPRARRTDPATSHAAAASAVQLAQDHHAMILQALQHGPAGKDGIAARIGLDGHRTGKRMCELERAGLIRLTGRTVPSASGRAEREWERVA